eukprot:15455917-Alexandrium_andersonii.AAC.1
MAPRPPLRKSRGQRGRSSDRLCICQGACGVRHAASMARLQLYLCAVCPPGSRSDAFQPAVGR